jgi:hypothetical protein
MIRNECGVPSYASTESLRNPCDGKRVTDPGQTGNDPMETMEWMPKRWASIRFISVRPLLSVAGAVASPGGTGLLPNSRKVGQTLAIIRLIDLAPHTEFPEQGHHLPHG